MAGHGGGDGVEPLLQPVGRIGLDDLVCEEMPGKPSLQPDQDDEDEGGDDAAEEDAPGKRASDWA